MQNTYRFEKIPKEINYIHISMTMSLKILCKMVNINETKVCKKLNDSLKWQCIFDTNSSPIVILILVMLPT